MSSMGSNRPRSALADGAERLTKLARTVREQQLADMPGARHVPVGNVYSLSPDEVWSKRFMSQGIGPTLDCADVGGFCAMPFTAQAPNEPVPAPAVFTVAAPAKKSVRPGPIGQAIGKPAKRRWWKRSP